MKRKLARALALMGMALVIAPMTGTAEVLRIELDVTGYLCGM
ncbi:MAG: hypothetical protein QOH06_1103 [Acidobacteriota bacterium]|jgi:hypothetical protein|nr:hypothetical protein [Acidobacteriota bacterium]